MIYSNTPSKPGLKSLSRKLTKPHWTQALDERELGSAQECGAKIDLVLVAPGGIFMIIKFIESGVIHVQMKVKRHHINIYNICVLG